MADNPTIDNNDLPDYTVATDDDGTAQHQYVKVEFGADGTQTKVSSANPMPVVDTALAAFVDGLEATLTAISGFVDGLEGFVDGIEGLLGATLTVGGNVAHDAVDSGNPVKIGGKASTDEPTAVAIGDRVNAWFDTYGRQVVVSGHADMEQPDTTNITTSADATLIAAPGAGLSLYICRGTCNNRDVAQALVTLKEGAAGSIRWRGPVAASGGQVSFDFGDRGWKIGDNVAFVGALGTTGDMDINVTEYYVAAA